MSSPSAILPIQLDEPALLRGYFGESGHVLTVMKNTCAILAVEPIIQARATIYTPSHVLAFLWHRFLTTDASYQSDDETPGSSYRKPIDGKIITVNILGSAKVSFFATHEICLITANALYYPFGSTSGAKNTVVCGPLRGRWQIEELDTLRSQGWSVYHYSDGDLVEDNSNLELEGELCLQTSRLFLDTHCIVNEHNNEEEGLMISTSTRLKVRDDQSGAGGGSQSPSIG
ncbi:hypothetical protein N7507_008234 [Penicillium longicatenatum]|nr:hypothetical protein N7507_008234 [Penicillium longicatenatum]